MAPAMSSSIQAFFPPAQRATTDAVGDGFTSEEVSAVLHPQINGPWVPETTYEEVEIGHVDAGPKCVTFKGRIANLYDQANSSKRPKAAKGFVRFVLKDDTGCITVRLLSS
jgi:hypothetical protein